LAWLQEGSLATPSRRASLSPVLLGAEPSFRPEPSFPRRASFAREHRNWEVAPARVCVGPWSPVPGLADQEVDCYHASRAPLGPRIHPVAPQGLLCSVAPQQGGHASTCPYRVTELCTRVPLTIEGAETLAARTASPGSSALEHCCGKVEPARVHVQSRMSPLGVLLIRRAGHCHTGRVPLGPRNRSAGLLRSNGEIEPPHVHVGSRSLTLGVPSTKGASHRHAERAP
jgi:hypothetical protein